MKKFIFIFVVFTMLCSCMCNSEKQPVNTFNASVENLISMDKQSMYLNHGTDYRWFETGIVLKDWLDEENDGSIEMVVNIFQVIENFDSTCFDTFVFKYQHTADGVLEDSVHGFWVEDYPLNDEVIKVSFKEAFEKVQEVNLPKPHTRQVVLRKQVGPKDCNPQWIFGNTRAQIYVDAVTGAVSKDNPAFDGLNLGTPLGEWP